MPGWHEASASLRKKHNFETVGIIQEQHADRCALFMQWKKMDWAVMVDSFNLLGVKVVPLTMGIDEFGVVRVINPDAATIEETFLSKTYTKPNEPEPGAENATDLRALAERAKSAAAWLNYGDALVRQADQTLMPRIIDAYERAVGANPNSGVAHFRLGVARRMRFDADDRRAGDFQAGVTHWSEALRLDPNQYLWRRRIQQYGPRMEKPYPFYDWVAMARREITDRGEVPVTLRVEPQGAELALPARKFDSASKSDEHPDPNGEVERDTLPIIVAETTVVPPAVKPGGVTRVYVMYRVNPAAHAHWNNESGPLEFWVDVPKGWETDTKLLIFDVPDVEQSEELRTIEFELRAPKNARPGLVQVPTFALYFVCRDADGICLFRRNDVTVPIEVQ